MIFSFFERIREKRVSRERILALDILRGLFMVCIVVDHTLGWSPSIISMFAGQGGLFASAAEGFFAISGILVGYVYREKIVSSTKWVYGKLWKRSLLLYLLTVGFSFVFYFWSLLLPSSSYGIDQWQGDFIMFVESTLTLSSVYGWHDFLAKYAVFMLFAPFALWLCSKGKAYLVLIISLIIWWVFRDQSNAAWQIIFVFGIVIGYYLNHIEPTFINFNRVAKKIPYFTLLSLASATYLLSVFAFTAAPVALSIFPDFIVEAITQLTHFRNYYFFPRNEMSIQRLLVVVLWFSAIYTFIRKHEVAIESKTRSLFSIIGRNSLFVFIFHGALLFVLYGLIGTQGERTNIALNTLIHIVLIIIVFFVARYVDHTKIASTLKNRMRKGEVL